MKDNEMIRDRNAYKVLSGKPEGRRPQGKPSCRCVDDIKVDLKILSW
jgi:hypothetical protein